jgi:ElaB/YqjD/DUF883 family membrane-anchored ribosome-binding protein
MNLNELAKQAYLNSLTQNLSDFDKLMLDLETLCDAAEDLARRAKKLADDAEAELRRSKDE